MTVVGAQRVHPFPGLRPFEPDEEHLFFGRETQVDELLGRLRRKRFVAVVGTSGSGKSSLVRAGMLPALYGGFMAGAGSHWRIALLRPGNQPITNLANALAQPHVLGQTDVNQQLQTGLALAVLTRGSLGLVEMVQQARLSRNENVLVLVDQFEELFRFNQSRDEPDSANEAAAFVKLLLAASSHPTPIYVVLTMRSDFLGDCAQFRDFPETINDGLFLVPRMTRDQLRSAIDGPIGVAGARIAPQLVARVLNEIGEDADQLPVLQHALMRTWDLWEADRVPDEPVDVRHYEATGGLKQALSLHADEIYNGLSNDRARQVAEKLFKCLTNLGSDNRGVRRPTPFRDACAIADASVEEVRNVVEAFRAPHCSFLMPPADVPLRDDTILDISHESLMRIWGRLHDWVNEEARSAQVYRRLAQAASLHGQSEAALWRNPDLAIGLSWQQKTQPNQAWAKRYDPAFDQAMQFLYASVEARDKEARDKEERRRRAILGTLAVFCLVLLIAVVSALVFAQQASVSRRAEEVAKQARREAQRNAERATAEKKAAQETKCKVASLLDSITDATITEAFTRAIGVVHGCRNVATNERVAASQELAKLPGGNRSLLTKGITAVYYEKVLDTNKIVPALTALGLLVTPEASQLKLLPTNAVWYGDHVSTNDAKIIALTLLKVGVKLQAVRHFHDGTGLNALKVEVGADADIVGKPGLTASQIAITRSFPRA